MEGHELASLWPHPWPQGQVFSRSKPCAHLQPTHPCPHLAQDPRISCLLPGSAQASSLRWSSQEQTTPSVFIPLSPRDGQRPAVWKMYRMYELGYPHTSTCTGKARSLDWEGHLRLEAGSFFALYLAECKREFSDFVKFYYTVLFVIVKSYLLR